MSRARTLRHQLLLFATVTLVACGIDGPTPPLPPNVSVVGRAQLSSVDESRLDAQLEREKQRIAAELEASKPVYDALKTEWERYLESSTLEQKTPFLICDPLQYVATTKIVGPEGADLDFGPHKLSIPAGALNNYVVRHGRGTNVAQG